MPDDPGVVEEADDVAVAEGGDLLRFEPGERPPERVALAEDREPRQSRLEALQAEFLVDAAVVGQRPAPLVVVVGLVLGRAAGPGTAPLPVRTPDRRQLPRVAHPAKATAELTRRTGSHRPSRP